jgi:hypothetical protein
MSAQPTTGDGRSWTTCPLLRIRCSPTGSVRDIRGMTVATATRTAAKEPERRSTQMPWQVRKSGDDSNRDSNVTTHRATVAHDDTRDREALTHLSHTSHRLVSAEKTQAYSPDTRYTLTCVIGPRLTHRISGTRQRIKSRECDSPLRWIWRGRRTGPGISRRRRLTFNGIPCGE